ncbi:MAG: A/G-specific adenine glycosylase [Planctomycetota bacterium]|nr:MAG: A/G-specific adenine glycosylase [Planctomycetota bacterium]
MKSSTSPALPDPRKLRRRLLAWYEARARDLPWRTSGDPWAVLLSEILLQQTTVAAATPYYERLLARWPDAAALAAAPLDELLAEWAGLGYYRRARLLHRTANVVAERGGELPRAHAELLALPGIGPYTAAAVASIAHGEAVAAVDGNVERVVARLIGLRDDVRRQPGKRRLAQAAQALLAPRRPGDWNQAVMELGATLCKPRSPDCPACPLRVDCVAHARGDVEAYPVLPARTPPTPVTLVAAVIVRRGRVLLRLRENAPNAGFLELPGATLPEEQLTPDGAPLDGPAALVAALHDAHALKLEVREALPLHKHAITRWRLRVHPFRATLSSGAARAPLRWWSASDSSPPLTTASRRILASAQPELLQLS